jgi:acyl-CoA reductase-like NAD-dependent aldehyde dehydrogenase
MSISRGLLVGGKEVPALSGGTTEDINPYTGQAHATVAAAGPEDVTAAVDAASASLDDWMAMAPTARRRSSSRPPTSSSPAWRKVLR